jgi:alkylation response protein AidB-like acyl-CoA dehydrogenase
MDLEWSEAERGAAQGARQALDELGPGALDELEAADDHRLEDLTRRALAALCRTGYLRLCQADRPADALELVAAGLEIARASGSLHVAVDATARLFGSLVCRHGSDGQRQAILEPLRRGGVVAGVALRDAAGAGAEARAVADGSALVVTARKPTVVNARLADWIAVSARIDGQPLFALVRRSDRGVTVGPRLRTLGLGGVSVAAVELDRVRVEADRVLGPFDDDAPLERLATLHDLVLAIGSVGLMQRLLEAAKGHASSHGRGGRPIAHYQEVGFKLAEMLTLVQTAELMTCRSAFVLASGEADARAMLAATHVFSAEMAEKVASMAMQILAGEGYLAGNVVERGYREAKYAAVAGRGVERARMAIADDVLDQFRS